MISENPPVLIVGAGPTGLTMANLLARMNIPFHLVDKNDGPSKESKAFAIHARTLEIFKQMGLVERAIKEGNIDNTIHLIIKGKEAAKLRLKEMLPGESNYPYLLILPQDKLEELMVESIENLEQKIHWRHEVSTVKEKENGVQVTIKDSSGKEKEREFQYVIGCDGSGSTVRKQGNFAFKGKTFSSTFYLADCEIDWEFPHGDIYFIMSPLYLSGVFSFPEKNRYRIFNFINTSISNTDKKELSFEDIQTILDDNPHLRMKAKNVNWTSVFKIHSRYTTNFQKGRIFLAGDAAHVHSPAGGQGMNTGIQDAYNLAWKLYLVLKEKAVPQLLETYHEERFPIAKNLHKSTDRLFQMMIRKSKMGDIFRMYIAPNLFRAVFGIEKFRKQNLRRLSQLSIKYRFSLLSKYGRKQSFKRNSPKPGDRAPYCKIIFDGEDSDIFRLFDCTRFTILIAVSSIEDQPETEFYENLKKQIHFPLKIFRITKASSGSLFFDTYGAKRNAVFIIRPDGHIGFRSSELNANEIELYFKNFSD